MLFKREINTNFHVDVNILDTLEDGFVLIIEEDVVNDDILFSIRDFVNKNSLSLLLDNERYFISKKKLPPSINYGWDS